MKRVKLLLVMVALTSAAPAFADDLPSPDLNGFRKQVAPLFAKFCVDCHGPDDEEGGLSLHKIDPNLIAGEDFETWRIIRAQLRHADMPPPDADQPTAAERATILKWIRAELLKTQMPGVVTDEKLLLPQFGNYVDHGALFDQRWPHVVPAKPRIWRLRPEIYNTIVPRLGERITGLANALNAFDDSEFKDFSAPYFLDEASTQQLFANAKKVARNLVGPNAKDHTLKALMQDTRPPEKEVRAAIDTAFRKALGRGPTADERERFLRLHRDSSDIGGHQTAAVAMLTAVLLQPEFMFRQELGDGQPDEFGRVRLAQREIAYALSYALADMPLTEFVQSAERGELVTSAQIAEVVRQRLLDDSPAYEKNPRIIQFFREYFHYPFAGEVFKDAPAGGSHSPSMLVADLELTIKDILKRDQQVLSRLLTTRDYYVNVSWGRKQTAGQLVQRDAKTRTYQTAFNLPLDWKWGVHLQPVRFRNDERAGVLTHPAWLAAWSGNFENHPVQRGKWIRTHLLGGTVPDVPIGVDARVPEQDNMTFRKRLKLATANSECWRCHKKMDPLGVAFERYDHYGRFQRLDAGRPVDSTAEIARTPFPELHKRFPGPTEMMDWLAKSERVEQVFVRHVFRYIMGRNETLGDANTLQDAHRAYRENDGSFQAIVVSLLSSDSFLLRQLTRPHGPEN